MTNYTYITQHAHRLPATTLLDVCCWNREERKSICWFTFIFVYQLWHFHSNVYSKVFNLQRILVPIMTFVVESKKGTDHSSYANSDVCMCHPWWVNEWLVIDVGEIFSFLLINNKLGVPGVASYRGHGISLAFINLFNQPTKFCGHLHLPRWRIFHQVWSRWDNGRR